MRLLLLSLAMAASLALARDLPGPDPAIMRQLRMLETNARRYREQATAAELQARNAENQLRALMTGTVERAGLDPRKYDLDLAAGAFRPRRLESRPEVR